MDKNITNEYGVEWLIFLGISLKSFIDVKLLMMLIIDFEQMCPMKQLIIHLYNVANLIEIEQVYDQDLIEYEHFL